MSKSTNMAIYFISDIVFDSYWILLQGTFVQM